MVNIFNEVKQGVFFKFEKVGDAIQGTYIGKMSAQGKFGPQIIYILQDQSGNVWNVSFNTTKKMVIDRMDGISFGQIVGFKLDEIRPTDKGNDAKIIRIYADPKYIDHTWLAAQKELKDSVGGATKPSVGVTAHETHGEEDEPADPQLFNGQPYFVAPEDANPSTGGLPKTEEKPKNDAIDAIRNLAKTKGLTDEGMKEKMADETIEQYTGLKLTEENLTKIIISLTGFTKK